MKRVAVAVLLLAALGVASCGDAEAPGTSKSPDHWSAIDERADAGVEPHSAKEYVPIALPEARLGSLDEWDHRLARRVVVNLEADGTVTFKSYEYHLIKDDASERAQALQALVEAIGRVKRQLAQDHAEGKSPLEGTMLHFDRTCAWRDTADCIRAAATATVPIDWLQIAVRRPGADNDHVMNLTLRRGEPKTGQGLQVNVRREHDRATEVRFSGQSWAFPAGDEFESAAFLARANQQWARFEESVRALRGSSVASITVGDGVRWAYVVKLLDILLEPPTRRIVFLADGLAVSLRSK